ncbi:MAG: DUF4290 domain-containing protein [Bacteroidales bacterium]|nr:DUF4290 domain-containing protein [Candidatus Sodaliphilus aphodohippi]
MLRYNTQQKHLVLPEYGRNVHQMIDHCLTIEDREERNRCAFTIIRIMDNMFPEKRGEVDYMNRLWDHLAIMSDFQLDIDWPIEVVRKDNLDSRPEPINYKLEKIQFRHYGKIIERMIERAAEYPEGEERDALIMLIANHMKKLIFQINKEDVDDAKIFKDLYHYSRGRIRLNVNEHGLHQFREAPAKQQAQGKKKKKK